jgi:hypothetical protein
LVGADLAARAGMAMATIIAATTNAAVATTNKRFTSTTSLPRGQTCRSGRLYNATTIVSSGC